MTGIKTAEHDANDREQAAAREARQKAIIALLTSFLTGPTPLTGPPHPSNEESTSDILFCGSSVAAATTATITTRSVHQFCPDEEEEEKEEEEEEDRFIPSPINGSSSNDAIKSWAQESPYDEGIRGRRGAKTGCRAGQRQWQRQWQRQGQRQWQGQEQGQGQSSQRGSDGAVFITPRSLY